MSYTHEDAGAPPDGAQGRADLAAGDQGQDGRSPEERSPEEEIVYPAQRGQEAVARLKAWSVRLVRPLFQPERMVTFVVVVACVVFVFMQFDPSLLFLGTTISGGDTGAHVLLPWVVMHQVLPHFRLEGWTSSNWDGFPAPTFYFPLPIYSIVALSQLIPYDVAFKLLTAAPMILMPVAAWLMGRLARAPFPVPAVLATATLPYMFGTEYSIYGGNIASTLAGEFAFAWSLWFALVFLGLVMRGMQTGRYRAWAAVTLACAFASHIDPTMFAGVGAVVIVVTHAMRNRDWRGALRWALPTMVVGGCLVGWWAWPFFERFPYVTDMGYTRITTYMSTLFPRSDTWLFIMAGIGAALSIARRRRVGELLTVMAVLAAVAFRYDPQSILWNARVLPFWFLTLYMLAALCVAELYAVMAERWTSFSVTMRAAALPGPLLVLLLALAWVGFPLRVLPGEKAGPSGSYQFLGIPQQSASYIPSWISWNYSGYQYTCSMAGSSCDTSDVKTRWPEYEQIVAEMESLSHKYGCGNLMWEYSSTMNDYGTTDALTILPYWTNGCIGSMEGLYYEASATTPFHFINQSELSLQPSDPMVGLPYASSPNVALGVQHLQMLGVKYYMAINPELQQQAAADPSLQLIATLGPYSITYSGTNGGPSGTQSQHWDIYLVKDAPRVHPLANQPVVMRGLDNSAQPKWLQVMTNWYDDPSSWNVYLAATGPASWARVPYGTTDVPVKQEPSTKVSGIVEHNSSISFHVSRTGVPVVVTVSYFPNWQVRGAQGVYRVSPNLMAVVPTSHEVTLYYGTTPVDYEGWAISLLALGGLVLLVLRPQVLMAAVRRPGLGGRQGPGRFERAIAAKLGGIARRKGPSGGHGGLGPVPEELTWTAPGGGGDHRVPSPPEDRREGDHQPPPDDGWSEPVPSGRGEAPSSAVPGAGSGDLALEGPPIGERAAGERAAGGPVPEGTVSEGTGTGSGLMEAPGAAGPGAAWSAGAVEPPPGAEAPRHYRRPAASSPEVPPGPLSGEGMGTGAGTGQPEAAEQDGSPEATGGRGA